METTKDNFYFMSLVYLGSCLALSKYVRNSVVPGGLKVPPVA